MPDRFLVRLHASRLSSSRDVRCPEKEHFAEPARICGGALPSCSTPAVRGAGPIEDGYGDRTFHGMSDCHSISMTTATALPRLLSVYAEYAHVQPLFHLKLSADQDLVQNIVRLPIRQLPPKSPEDL